MSDRDQIARQALAAMAEQDALRHRERELARSARRSWHLVQISSKASALAREHLRSRDLEVYRPMLRLMVVPKARELSIAQRKNRHLFAREKIVPLFGVYHFVRFDPERDPWHDIFKTVGVYGIACANNRPRPLPDALVEGLRAKEVNGAINEDLPIEELPLFKIGELVRVTFGPFRGFNGKIGSLDEAGRISLLLDLFGRSTPVSMTIDDVAKI